MKRSRAAGSVATAAAATDNFFTTRLAMSSLNDDEDRGEIQLFSSHIAPDDADVPSASATALEIEHRSLTHCLAFPHSVRRPVGRLNIAAQLNQQRLTGQHCDCTLIVRFQPHARSLDVSRVLVLPAHKAVLAAASDYFDVMFKQSLPNDSEFTIYFELRDEVDAFPSLLDFMYRCGFGTAWLSA
jgi:hypothetical protein